MLSVQHAYGQAEDVENAKMVIIKNKDVDIVSDEKFRTLNVLLSGFPEGEDVNAYFQKIKEEMNTDKDAGEILGMVSYEIGTRDNDGLYAAKFVVAKRISLTGLAGILMNNGFEYIKIGVKLRTMEAFIRESKSRNKSR